MIVYSNAPSDRRITREAKALAENGFVVNVVYPSVSRAKINKKGNITYIPALTGVWMKTTFRFLVFWMVSLTKKKYLKPAVVHCHDANTLPAGYLLSRIYRCHLIYDSHEWTAGVKELKNRKIKRFIWSVTEKYFAQKADAVITVNGHISRMLRRYRKLRGTPFVVMNASELKPSKRGQKRKSCPKTVVYHSALVWGRGFEKILHSFAQLDGARMIVFGEGDAKETFMKKAKESGADVIFAGWAEGDELAIRIQNADVGLSMISGDCINNRLSSANKIFDYACLGIPQLGSNYPVMRELIEKKAIGLCADEKDPESIVSALKKLLFDENTKKIIIENLRAEKDQYSWDREKKKLLEIYEKLLRKRNKSDQIQVLPSLL
ncbi:glycosyltransferase [candidate division WOR-3 bacterium]|nr:glycosyltransferase [candidate division WOR-3 bacterium]